MKKALSAILALSMLMSATISPAMAMTPDEELDFLNDTDIVINEVETFGLEGEITTFGAAEGFSVLEVEELDTFSITENMLSAIQEADMLENETFLDSGYTAHVKDSSVIGVQAAKADLLPQNLKAYTGFKEPFPVNKTVLFTVDILNIGGTNARNIPVKLYMNNDHAFTFSVDSLTSMQGRTIAINLQSPYTGTFTMGIEVNPGGSAVPEDNLTNNITYKNFTWVSNAQVYDYVAYSVYSDEGNEYIPLNQDVQFYVTIANGGGQTLSSQPFTIYINNTPILSSQTGRMEAGEGRYFGFLLNFNQNAVFNMKLVINSHSSEWNTINNTLEETFSACIWHYFHKNTPLSKHISTGYGGYATHYGFDIVKGDGSGTTAGTPCYAVNDGVVSQIGYETRASGHYIYLTLDDIHPTTRNNIIVKYLHLIEPPNDTNPSLQKDRRVYRGNTLVGRVGDTGNSYGAHLHFQVNNHGSLSGGENFTDTDNPITYFLPIVAFTGDTVIRNLSQSTLHSLQDILAEAGLYRITSEFIDYVGMDAFNEWVENEVQANPERLYTFIDFMEHFSISTIEFQKIVEANHLSDTYSIGTILTEAASKGLKQ